jgi:spore coat protein U-like protein
MTTVLKKLSAVAVLALAANTLQAATATGSLNVSAVVQPRCQLGAAPTLTFPTYVQGLGDVSGFANIALNCTAGTAVTIGLDGLVGGFRTLAGPTGTDNLQYNLYKENTLTDVWDNSGAGLLSYTYGAGGQVDHTVYGRIVDSATNQAQVAGNYSATVVVTVTW